MKIKIPDWAGGKIKEILKETPKTPEQAMIKLQAMCLEQQKLINEALKRSDNPDDTRILNKMHDVFANLEQRANQFNNQKRKIGVYLKAIMQVAKLPKAEKERYKKLVGVNG